MSEQISVFGTTVTTTSTTVDQIMVNKPANKIKIGLKSINRALLVPRFILTIDEIPGQWLAEYQYQVLKIEELILIVRNFNTCILFVCVCLCYLTGDYFPSG